MQLHFRTPLLMAITATLVLASCSKSNKVGRMVPKEAGFVMHINGKSLSGKINMAEFKQTDLYKQVTEEFKADSSQSDFMNKLKDYNQNIGIDSLSDFVFFADNSNKDASYFIMQAGMKDAGSFEKFLKSVYPQGSISKENGLQVMTVENKAVMTWNNDKVIVGFVAPQMRDYIPPGDNGNEENLRMPQVATYCKNLYTLKEDNSLAKEDKFTDMVNTEGDVHAWVNYEKLISNLPDMGMLSMMKTDNFLTGNITAYTLNFENGKIAIKSKGYAGKELNALLKKYSGGNVNTAMLKNIPSKDIVGVLALHFDPEGLKELVKLSGMDGFIDIFLGLKGFTIDDFINANKGDVMVAVSDLSMKKDSTSYEDIHGRITVSSSYDKPDAKFIFSAAIKDKDAFAKMINFAKKEGGDLGSKEINYNSNKDYFAIGNSTELISRYLAGGSNNDLPFISKLSSSPIGMYIDLQKILKILASRDEKDSITKKITEASVKMWENVILNGGDYSGGGINQTLEVNLIDKNTNSLKQLFTYGLTMAALEKERQKIYLADVEEVKVPELDKVAVDKTVPVQPKINRKK